MRRGGSRRTSPSCRTCCAGRDLNRGGICYTALMSKLPKHHYIPVFYLQQWADNRGRLVEYSRQGRHNFVKARPTSPKGTGYVRGLNLIPGATPDIAHFVEKQFL